MLTLNQIDAALNKAGIPCALDGDGRAPCEAIRVDVAEDLSILIYSPYQLDVAEGVISDRSCAPHDAAFKSKVIVAFIDDQRADAPNYFDPGNQVFKAKTIAEVISGTKKALKLAKKGA